MRFSASCLGTPNASPVTADWVFRGVPALVSELQSWLYDVCHPHWPNITSDLAEPNSTSETAFRNLVHEWLRLLTAEQLFEFVLNPEVDPTNNLSE